MATWGSQTWGFSNWGTLGDISVTVSGQSTLSLSVGSVEVQQVPGWGTQYWGAGEWGDLKSPEAAVTGQELTSATQTVTAFTDVTIEPTGQQLGPITIGDYIEGISVEADPLGQELNSTVNSVFAGELIIVPVTSASNEAWGENAWSDGGWGVGDGQTISIGDTSVAIGQQIDAQGQELTATVNDVLAGISIVAEPAGEELTPDLGSLSFESKYLIGSAEATTTVNSVDVQANADVEVSTNVINGDTGQLEYEATYSFDGSQADVTAGDAFGGEVVEVQVTTASAQPWGETAWGDGQWGQSVGTDIEIGNDAVLVPSVEVELTGIDINSTVANVSITADANLSLTGQEVEVLQGDENAFTDVTIEVSGQELTTELNNVVAGISQLIIPTGVTATVTNGTMGINAWAVVDPNANTTWTVVDKAAA
jgi:hypothetical protein